MKKKYIIIAISLIIVTTLVVCGYVFTVDNVEVVFDNKTNITKEYDILNAAGISNGTIIFNIKEADIKSRIAKQYKDNSIVVTNVVRLFPNKIKIYVKERVLLYKINVYSQSDGNEFVPTDKDFQRGVKISDIDDLILISVKNFVVKDTFNLEECYQLKELADSFITLGISEDSLPYFIEYVEFEDSLLEIKLRHSNGVFYISRDRIKDEIKSIYSKYNSLSDQDKLNCILEA